MEFKNVKNLLAENFARISATNRYILKGEIEHG